MRLMFVLLVLCAGMTAGRSLHAQSAPAQSTPIPPAAPPALMPAPPGGDVPGLLYHVHHTAGINCAACHTETPPARPASATVCLSCHGPLSALIAKTAGDQPNPHAVAHIGPLACTDCHHIHTASQLFCNQCHSFDMTVP